MQTSLRYRDAGKTVKCCEMLQKEEKGTVIEMFSIINCSSNQGNQNLCYHDKSLPILKSVLNPRVFLICDLECMLRIERLMQTNDQIQFATAVNIKQYFECFSSLVES